MSKQLAQDGFTGKYVQFAGKRHRLVKPAAILEWKCKGGCGTTIDSGKFCADCETEGKCLGGCGREINNAERVYCNECYAGWE